MYSSRSPLEYWSMNILVHTVYGYTVALTINFGFYEVMSAILKYPTTTIANMFHLT